MCSAPVDGSVRYEMRDRNPAGVSTDDDSLIVRHRPRSEVCLRSLSCDARDASETAGSVDLDPPVRNFRDEDGGGGCV
jgi:hypothetical protein